MLTSFSRSEKSRPVLATIPRNPVTGLQPFGLSPDPHFIYRSDPYIWAFEQVTTAVRQREGLVLVTGEPGTGKTLLCRTLLARLSERHAISVVLDPYVSFEELLTQVLQDFGVLPDRQAATGLRRHDLIATLHRFLASLIPLHTTAVLVIDEAQHLHPAVFEELRLLSNCESDHAKLLQIVLVGTSTLDGICRSEGMRHLDQRIARRCHLRPLDRNEIVEYIESRLTAAGLAPGEFSATAVRLIAALSGGVPRTVNLLCERSMDVARRRGVSPVNDAMVRAAAGQLNIAAPRMRRLGTRTAAVASVVLIGLPSVTYLAASHTNRAPHAAAASPAPSAVESRTAGVALASVATNQAIMNAAQADAATGTLVVADALTIQVASLRQEDRAAAVVQQLRAAGLPAFRRIDGSGLRHIVFVGPYVTDGEVQAIQQQLAMQGFTQSRVMHEEAGSLLP